MGVMLDNRVYSSKKTTAERVQRLGDDYWSVIVTLNECGGSVKTIGEFMEPAQR